MYILENQNILIMVIKLIESFLLQQVYVYSNFTIISSLHSLVLLADNVCTK